MAGLVIPVLAVNNCEADKKGGTAYPGCYRGESCGGASLRPFRVPFRLFRVQTCYKICSGGWVSGGGGGVVVRKKQDESSDGPPRRLYNDTRGGCAVFPVC